MNQKIKVTFYGGAGSVTGSNYLIETDKMKMLVDCGLFQGTRVSEERNKEPFPYDPASIDALFVSHAHLDHVGRIPKLVKEGFKGEIFSTMPTRDFAKLMLIDSLGVMRKEARKSKEETIYSEDDVENAMKLWETVDYHNRLQVGDFEINFREAGHILGSAMIEISRSGKKILFSGDLGNPPNPILRDMEKISDIDYLSVESTYGDREHEKSTDTKLKLERAIENTVHEKGVLMIPAFSLERTQKLLFQIDELVENGRIPRVPIFLDSPLAIKATEIYKKYSRYYNDRAKEIIRSGDSLFQFPGLKMTLRTDESKQINNVPAPKIIIAGSGMSNGGRIIHHEKRYLSDPKSTLLIIGYQASGSLGRRLLEGEKTVKILGETISVRAKVESIHGYSAHPDMNDLFDFVSGSVDTLKKVFVVQGEPKSSLFFVQRLRDHLGVDAIAPKVGDSFILDL